MYLQILISEAFKAVIRDQLVPTARQANYFFLRRINIRHHQSLKTIISLEIIYQFTNVMED